MATASYGSRLWRRAWQVTKSDFGLHDRRRVFVKIVWLGLTILVLWLFGLNEILKGQIGETGSIVVALVGLFSAVFLWNLAAAPAQLRSESDAKIAELEKVIDNREVRQTAMARLWRLRKQGVKLRNQPIANDEEYEAWATKRKRWRLRVLKQAGLISPNFKAWLETLDRTRQPPQVAAPLVDGKYQREHARSRRITSEILMRVEET